MASTNKTANLDLNQWSLSDKPEMADFNTDNTKVDTAISAHLAEMATQSNLGHVRLQEAFISATLLNGWTGNADYAKNDLGIVTLYALLTAGTVESLTNILTLPTSYRPPRNMVVPLVDNPSGAVTGKYLYLATNGNLRVPGGNVNQPIAGSGYQFSITFYAEG